MAESANKVERNALVAVAKLGKRLKGASVITHSKDAKKAASYEDRRIGRR